MKRKWCRNLECDAEPPSHRPYCSDECRAHKPNYSMEKLETLKAIRRAKQELELAAGLKAAREHAELQKAQSQRETEELDAGLKGVLAARRKQLEAKKSISIFMNADKLTDICREVRDKHKLAMSPHAMKEIVKKHGPFTEEELEGYMVEADAIYRAE